jgi:hypothetical protein
MNRFPDPEGGESVSALPQKILVATDGSADA